VTVCKPETRTRKVHVSKMVPVEETCTVAVCTNKVEKKEVEVQVCHMVEKEVECKVWKPAACCHENAPRTRHARKACCN